MQRLGNYELVRRIASGGMGEVFLAQTRGTDGFEKQVVVKRIFPHFRDNPEYRRLFVREAKVTSRLVHPNIVQVIDLGEQEGELFLAMEYVRGTDLQSLLRHPGRGGGGLQSGIVAVVAYDILEALDHAHNSVDEHGRPLGIIHHDVSPQNVLVSLEGFCKLCDFGIARIEQNTATNHAAIRGKFAYAAPEQLAGQRVDARADLFSLGVVLYEAITGARLYQVGTLTERRERDRDTATTLQVVASDHDADLLAIVARLLKQDPEARFPSAAAVRDALEPVLMHLRPRAARTALAEIVRSCAAPAAADDADAPRTQLSRNWQNLLDRSPIEVTPVTPTLKLGPTNSQAPTARLSPSPSSGESFDRTVIKAALRGPTVEPDGPITVTSRPSRWPWVKRLLMSGGPLVAAGLVGLVIGRSSAPPGTTAPVAPPTQTTPPRLAPPAPAAPGPASPSSGEPSVADDPPRVAAVAETAETPAPGQRPRKREGQQRGFLTVNATPWAYVTVDGQRLPKTTPVLKLPLSTGRHLLEVEGPQGETRRLVVEVRAGAVPTKPVRFGTPAPETTQP